MNQVDFDGFRAALLRLADSYLVELTSRQIAAYWDGLKVYDWLAVEAALANAPKSYASFFPKLGELLTLIEGSVEDRAELAWRTFLELTESSGYPSLQVYDGAMAFAVECMGGWLAACDKLREASQEMIAHHSKAFRSSYKIGQMRGAEARYFPGRFEVNNRELGTWKAPTFPLEVALAAPGKIQKIAMPFDFSEGRLTAEARAALTARGDALRPYLPAKPAPVPALPPASGDMAAPEEVAELKRKIKGLADNVRQFPIQKGA